MSHTILLVDHHKIFREGLCSLLTNNTDYDVIGEADDGQSAISLADDLKPDIIIIEVSLPKKDGVEITRTILSRHPEICIVALSMSSHKHFIAGMMRAGAQAYVLKSTSFEELKTAIESVVSGKNYLSESISTIALDDYKDHLKAAYNEKSKVLSKREQKVLELLTEGHSSKEIALTLSKSPKTIDACRRQIMNKLQIDNMADLIKYAIREGLTNL